MLQYVDGLPAAETEDECERSLSVRGTTGPPSLSQGNPTPGASYHLPRIQLGRRQTKVVPEPTFGDPADTHTEDKETGVGASRALLPMDTQVCEFPLVE